MPFASIYNAAKWDCGRGSAPDSLGSLQSLSSTTPLFFENYWSLFSICITSSLESTSWLTSSATTSPVSTWLLYDHVSLPASSSPFSPSVASLFHSRLKTFIFHKSFPPQTTGTLRTDFVHYWTVRPTFSAQRFSFHFIFYSALVPICFLLVIFSFTTITSNTLTLIF